MTDLAAWLETLSLGQYASVFAANEVDRGVLTYLSDQEYGTRPVAGASRVQVLEHL